MRQEKFIKQFNVKISKKSASVKQALSSEQYFSIDKNSLSQFVDEETKVT